MRPFRSRSLWLVAALLSLVSCTETSLRDDPIVQAQSLAQDRAYFSSVLSEAGRVAFEPVKSGRQIAMYGLGNGVTADMESRARQFALEIPDDCGDLREPCTFQTSQASFRCEGKINDAECTGTTGPGRQALTYFSPSGVYITRFFRPESLPTVNSGVWFITAKQRQDRQALWSNLVSNYYTELAVEQGRLSRQQAQQRRENQRRLETGLAVLTGLAAGASGRSLPQSQANATSSGSSNSLFCENLSCDTPGCENYGGCKKR